MRIERLVMEGFGPFADRQVVDFRELDEAGLFLITGRTGSGKSSILDAICFALYGSAPRYDGVQARLRSDHARVGEPTRVELDFAVGAEHWRVVRSPEYERPKLRGGGTTKEPQAATLFRRDGEEWVAVAARPVDVAEHIAPVLQLTVEQFLQVILLAQGRFQEFLRAASEDRLRLLRALFGTDRFARVEQEVAERAKALESTVGIADTAMRRELARLGEVAGTSVPADADPAWATAVAARLDGDATAAHGACDAAERAFAEADAAAAGAASLAERQCRRRDARAALAALAAEEPTVAAARARLSDGVRVLPVLPAVEAAERADAESAVAEGEHGAAAAALGAPVPDPPTALAEADGLLGSLAGPLSDEQALPRLLAAVALAAEQRSVAAERAAAARAEAAELPGLRADRQGAYARAAAAAEGVGPGEVRLAAAHEQAGAAVRAERLERAVRAAETVHTAALATEQAAIARTRALLTARVAGAAGALAAGLATDEPCPVCGSADHPSPAPLGPDAPDDRAVESAEAEQRAAADRSAARSADAASVREQLGAARVAAGGLTIAAAEQAETEARAAVRAARDALAERDRIAGELDRIATRESSVAGAIESRRVALEAAADRHATADSLHAEAAARVASARGDASSVAGRAAELSRRRTALRRLVDAATRLDSTRAIAADAHGRLAVALEAAGLPDAATARRLGLSRDARDTLQDRIDRWDTARHGAQAALADPGVAAAAEEPADVTGTAAVKATALARQSEAAHTLAEARQRAGAAHALAVSIVAADAGLAGERELLDVLRPLADTLRGTGANDKRMRLESYVLAARLEQIVAAANGRLRAMTDGRFSLQHDDGPAYRGARAGLGLEVLDEHTGRPRPVASLSGGETFLASLALALGLAEVVSAEAGGVRLDTLFVDEGFGSLDRRTLDTAMETLDALRAGGRTVGLISHVEAMQEDVPAGLHVERTPAGPSRIRLRTPVP